MRYFYQKAYPLGYEQLVLSACEENELEPSFVFAVIRTESSFRPDAQSSVGARGLMQITEETFQLSLIHIFALRKLPICVLTKIHKNVHGRACFFPGLCGSKNIIKNTMQRRKQHKRMERIPQKEQNQAPAAAPTRKKRIMP